jgi:Tfp pilus assembly protein PilX
MNSKHQGLALPTLMVMLSVTSLAALLAMRNLWINDQLLNAEADHVRSQHVAEAVLPIAVQDIAGLSATTHNLGEATTNLRHTIGTAEQTHAFFPTSMSEYDVLRQRLATSECSAGICAPLSPIRWTKASDWKAQTKTAMLVSATDSPYGANTAWYWVEVFPQETTHTWVYRITVLATGVLPGSTTVLQALWTRSTASSTTGQWHGWQLLHD